MSKKFKIPKIPDKEMKELAEAVQFAYSDDAADAFFDEVMAKARHSLKLRIAREQQTRTE